MKASVIAEALAGARLDFADLSDGTAVIASLESGRMITLNPFGTSVVKVLLDSADPEPALDALALAVAAEHGTEHQRVVADIDAFLAMLATALDGH